MVKIAKAPLCETKFIIIHYNEIGIKKGNRGFFERQLRINLQRALADQSYGNVIVDFGRFRLTLREDSDVEMILSRIKNVMGIAHFSLAYLGPDDLAELTEEIFEKVRNVPFESFCVRTRRVDKKYPHHSIDVNRIVGERIFEALKRPVKLKNPEMIVYINVYNGKVIYYYERTAGLGGLPVGSSGKVVCLLSSGIDSPVAAYRMMFRGCKVIFVHFHSYPFTSKESYYNASVLADKLTCYQNSTYLYLAPLAQLQEAIIMAAPAKYRLLLYRRMMFRLAERIAMKEKAKAIITGESLGQVASQTLENIAATSDAVSIPILRPLIGRDKESIITEARIIDTFETSIEPYEDCCSYLVPDNPATRANAEDLQEVEALIENMDQLLHDALKNVETERFKFPELEKVG